MTAHLNQITNLKVDDIFPWHPDQNRRDFSHAVNDAALQFQSAAACLELQQSCGDLSVTFLLCASGLKFVIHPAQDKSRRITMEPVNFKLHQQNSILNSIRQRVKIIAGLELRGFVFEKPQSISEGIEILADLWNTESHRPKWKKWREPCRHASLR